jgi:hypothetical protein
LLLFIETHSLVQGQRSLRNDGTISKTNLA